MTLVEKMEDMRNDFGILDEFIDTCENASYQANFSDKDTTAIFRVLAKISRPIYLSFDDIIDELKTQVSKAAMNDKRKEQQEK